MAGHLRRLAMKTGDDFPYYSGLFDVADCQRDLFVRRSGSFSFYLPFCVTHRWIGQETSCEFEAGAQICVHHVHAKIAACRAERAEREGFVRYRSEVL